MCSSNIFLAVIALFFAPLPVWVKRGLCSPESLINIALCCLGIVPGILHSWYIIYTTPDYFEYERVIDVEGGRQQRENVTYYYVEGPRAGGAAQQPGYGSMGGNPPQRSEQAGSAEVPPTYTEAIKGDNKVQRS